MPDAGQARLSRIFPKMGIRLSLRELLSIARIRRRERVVQRTENVRRRFRSSMRSYEVQFPLNRGAEVVQIEIVQVIVERVFDFLADLEESEEQERRKGCTWYGDPAKLGVDLELKTSNEVG